MKRVHHLGQREQTKDHQHKQGESQQPSQRMADSRFKEVENNVAPVKCGITWANTIASITTRIGKQGVIGTQWYIRGNLGDLAVPLSRIQDPQDWETLVARLNLSDL